MTTVDVLLFDGCEALDALGPREVLAYGGLDADWLADAGLVGPRASTTHHQYWDALPVYGASVRRIAQVRDPSGAVVGLDGP